MSSNHKDNTINFQLSEEQEMIRQLARDFARNEMAPVAEEYDRSHEFAWPVIRKAQELGLTMMNIPEEYGGLGLSLFEEVLVGEELSWGCSGMSTAISRQWAAPCCPSLLPVMSGRKKITLGELSTARWRLIAPPSPRPAPIVAGIKTTAVKNGDHYVFNGSKTFIPALRWPTSTPFLPTPIQPSGTRG